MIDGDTIVLDIDLGFGIWRLGQKVRVLGVNAPEMRGAPREAGRIAKAATTDWLQKCDPTFTIQTLCGRNPRSSFRFSLSLAIQ